MPKYSCCTSETQGWRFLRVRECAAPKNRKAAHSLNPVSQEAPLRAFTRNKNRKCAALDTIQRSAPSYFTSCRGEFSGFSCEAQYAVAYVLRSLSGFRRPPFRRPDARLREVSAFRPGGGCHWAHPPFSKIILRCRSPPRARAGRGKTISSRNELHASRLGLGLF